MDSMVIELFSDSKQSPMSVNMSDSVELETTSISVTINDSSVTTSEMPAENVFILPLWQQFLWTLVFGTMVLVAAGGNIIVIWIVLAHKRMVSLLRFHQLAASILQKVQEYVLDDLFTFDESSK